MVYGHICSESSEAKSLKITWKIPQYSSLPHIYDYSVDSSPFIFANATWCLKLYPNNDGTSVSLMRLHSLMTRHKITCMFDVLKQNGECLKGVQEYRPLKFYDGCRECESYNIEESGIPELVADQNVLTSDGTLVFMGHLLFEESTEEEHIQQCRSDKSK